jgi:glycosyltransferase involved in cell wall biosynthesis
MRINFLVNQVFDGWEPTDTRLGGTERGVVEWAEELQRRGHIVSVYRNSRDGIGYFCGVEYWPRESYRGDGDVCINIKSPEVAPKEPTIFYTNDVDADKQDLSKYDAVLHLSQYAKDNIPVNNPNVYIVPHGYDDKLIYPGKKIPKQCFYASSPDRGLDTLLEAWPQVYAAHPDATLLVTYGGTGPALPGVMYMGELTEEEMAEIYRTSDIWCHPCNGGELYCITGIKAQAAGCVPVILPTMALKETVKTGYFTDKKHYAEMLIEAFQPDSETETIRGFLAEMKFPTIADSTDKLLEIIQKVYNKK